MDTRRIATRCSRLWSLGRPIPTSRAWRCCAAVLTVSPVEMLEADGYLLGTTANLGYISGALTHFFDTIYYPSLDHVSGRPYGLWVHGNKRHRRRGEAVEKVATGLSLNKATDVLEVTGAIDAAVREQAYELGGTLAATLME